MTGALLIEGGAGLSQGDLILAPMARVGAAERFTPERWDRLDEHSVRVRTTGQTIDDIHLYAGRAVLMVTSHDCHHDKEWNEAVRLLTKQGVAPHIAEERAQDDDTLDRSFQASPVVPLDDFPADKRDALRRGQVVGYLPLPANLPTGLPDAVVDLTYRATIDRFAIEKRLYGLNPAGRAQLRLCLARFDALRSVNLGFELESVVGQRIAAATVVKTTGIEITLTLDNGDTLRFLQQPVDPAPGGRRGI